MIIKVKLETIKPNPYQPNSRLKIDDAIAEKFGKSILEHGLLQTPVVRHGKPDNLDVFEMGDGWLRLSGFRWLVAHGHPEFAEMPLDIRDFSDLQMADLVLEANRVHQDLSPIDKADFYRRYLSTFKITQAEFARRHDISQGEVANTIRLLELPVHIQAKVISQEICETHARILIALKDWPGLLQELVKKIIATGMTTASLEAEVRQITNKQKKTRTPVPPPCAPPVPPPAPLKETIVTEEPDLEEKPAAALGLPLLSKPVAILPENIPVSKAPTPEKSQDATQKPSKIEEIKKAVSGPAAVPPKWKRKLALEETDNGVRVSLMSEKRLVIKTLVGNLETCLEEVALILADATAEWMAKEKK